MFVSFLNVFFLQLMRGRQLTICAEFLRILILLYTVCVLKHSRI